jgi:hypothetical protein
MMSHRMHGGWPAGIALVVLALFASLPGQGPRAPKQPNTNVATWQALLPAIQEALNRQKPQCPRIWQAGVIDAADFEGGLSVALVDNCDGGAYTDSITVMQLQKGKPAVARFRSRDGKIAEVGFLQGSSVMHSVDVQLVPDKNAIYDIHSDNGPNGRLAGCVVTAYVWNGRSGTFDWSRSLTRQATRDYCHSLRSAILK